MIPALEGVDWKNIDDDKLVSDYIEMPDGSHRVVQLTMLHWYLINFRVKEVGVPLTPIIQDIIDTVKADPEADLDKEFDYLLGTCILAWGREWIRVTEGR